MKTFLNVPIAETGIEYPASTGPITFTVDDLADMVASQKDPAIVPPRLKLGHTDSRFAMEDGEPAFGLASNLTLTNNGHTVMCDYSGVPDWLGNVLPTAYPNRSIEGNWDVETVTGHKWRFVCSDVALLGVLWPGISTLDDLKVALSDAGPEGVEVVNFIAASGIAAQANMEDVRRNFYEVFATESEDRYWWWIRALLLDPNEIIADDDDGGLFRVPFTIKGDGVEFDDPVSVKVEYVDLPAQKAAATRLMYASAGVSRPANRHKEESVPQPKATASVELETLRKALGLPEDATEEQVNAKLAEMTTDAWREANLPAPDPEKTADPAPPATPVEPVAVPAAASIADGTVTVDKETLASLQRDATLGRTAFENQRSTDRETYLSAAVQLGKFPPARVEHWRKAWETEYSTLGNSDGVKAAIDSMPEGLIPVGPQVGVVPGTDDNTGPAYPSNWLPELGQQHQPTITQES